MAPPRPERPEQVDDDAGERRRRRRRTRRSRVSERRRRTCGWPTTTASAAPASTPRMPGSASGLRVTPCMTPPASPRAPPTPRPRSVRGTRRLAHDQVVVRAVGVDERLPHGAERDRLGAEGDRGTRRRRPAPRGPRPGRPPGSNRSRATERRPRPTPDRRIGGDRSRVPGASSRGPSMTAVMGSPPPGERRRQRCKAGQMQRWSEPATVGGQRPTRSPASWGVRRARMTAVQSTGAIAPEGVTSDEVGVAGRRHRVGDAPPARPLAGRRRAPHRRRSRWSASASSSPPGCATRIGGAEEDLVDVYERVPDRFAEALTGLAVIGAGVVPVAGAGRARGPAPVPAGR